MFEKNSRYTRVDPYEVEDNRGRKVTVVPVPDPPDDSLLGIHLRKESHRPDHLAYKYLQDGTGFWRISEANDVMLPETLSEQSEIKIPNKNR